MLNVLDNIENKSKHISRYNVIHFIIIYTHYETACLLVILANIYTYAFCDMVDYM